LLEPIKFRDFFLLIGDVAYYIIKLVFFFVIVRYLDVVAPVLVNLKKPVVLVKVNADKYTRLAMKNKVKYISSTISFLFY